MSAGEVKPQAGPPYIQRRPGAPDRSPRGRIARMADWLDDGYPTHPGLQRGVIWGLKIVGAIVGTAFLIVALPAIVAMMWEFLHAISYLGP